MLYDSVAVCCKKIVLIRSCIYMLQAYYSSLDICKGGLIMWGEDEIKYIALGRQHIWGSALASKDKKFHFIFN